MSNGWRRCSGVGSKAVPGFELHGDRCVISRLGRNLHGDTCGSDFVTLTALRLPGAT